MSSIGVSSVSSFLFHHELRAQVGNQMKQRVSGTGSLFNFPLPLPLALMTDIFLILKK